MNLELPNLKKHLQSPDTGYPNYPKYRAKPTGNEVKIQKKHRFWPFWIDAENYDWIDYYNSIEKANRVIEGFILVDIQNHDKRQKIKAALNQNGISANDYYEKFPEKFL